MAGWIVWKGHVPPNITISSLPRHQRFLDLNYNREIREAREKWQVENENAGKRWSREVGEKWQVENAEKRWSREAGKRWSREVGRPGDRRLRTTAEGARGRHNGPCIQ